jgi:hypothetical protein
MPNRSPSGNGALAVSLSNTNIFVQAQRARVTSLKQKIAQALHILHHHDVVAERL